VAVVGLLAHEGRPAARELRERTEAWLADLDHEVVDLASERGDLPHLDLAVSLGGDGTMLRTVRLVAPAGVPVLGVNLGHLGYLTTVEPEGLRDALAGFLSGRHRLDERMTLDVALDAPDAAGAQRWVALNDVVLQRTGGGHTVRLGVQINGRPFVSFAADALIVATPTGSTAYNLSARGPIVSPRARVQILTPVAPHSLFDRSLVLAADEAITVAPFDGRSADLVVDGRSVGQVDPGARLEVSAGGLDARLVTFHERHFEGILARKFDLPGR